MPISLVRRIPLVFVGFLFLLAPGLDGAAPLEAQERDSLRTEGVVSDTFPTEAGAPALEGILLGRELSLTARRELEPHLARRPTILEGDREIPRDSVFPNGLLVVGGTLRFQGRTPGTVMVVGGDLFLRPGAEIGGDVVVIEGHFYGTGMATLSGQVREIRGEEVVVLRRPGEVEISAPPERRPFPVGFDGSFYGFFPDMYNRVDGLSIRWGLRYVPPKESADALRLGARAIVRTSRENIGWEANAEREFRSLRLTLGGSWYNVTDTAERWHRGDVETSLSTLFLGEDNRFYFDRRGVELKAAREVRGPLSLDLAFRNDTYRNVTVQDPFTVASDDFLPNLPVEAGTMRSFLAGATWDGRDHPENVRLGWWGRLEGEAAGGFLEGNQSFTSGRLDLRRYQPVGSHQLDIRIVLGGRLGGTLPEQRRFHLGGAATLPGYEALEIRGDRTALLNLRYSIPLPALKRLGIFREGAWVVLLGDAGDAWESRDDDPDWLSSGGVGVAGRGPFSDIGIYAVVPSETIGDDQSDVSVFLFFGRFF
jgi:hypothetical protein